MKKSIILTSAFVLSSLVIFAQTSKHHETDSSSNKVYTCPMHPEVISNKPGKCPKCGMTLVEKRKEKHAMDSTMPKKKKDS
jgi:hypothetical protein